jgi:hypothetical protein
LKIAPISPLPHASQNDETWTQLIDDASIRHPFVADVRLASMPLPDRRTFISASQAPEPRQLSRRMLSLAEFVQFLADRQLLLRTILLQKVQIPSLVERLSELQPPPDPFPADFDDRALRLPAAKEER